MILNIFNDLWDDKHICIKCLSKNEVYEVNYNGDIIFLCSKCFDELGGLK